MEETKIILKLDTIKKVNDFVSLVSKYNEEITIKSHRYEVNAKSIMGIFSLNLLEAINVCLYTNDKNIQNQFIKEMNIFKEA